jgi:hypothetical protein
VLISKELENRARQETEQPKFTAILINTSFIIVSEMDIKTALKTMLILDLVDLLDPFCLLL